MTRRPMPPEPDGERIVSSEVFDHTAVQAFKNAGCAFAICVDDEKGAVWVARRGRTPDPDDVVERAFLFALYAAQAALRMTGGDAGGRLRPGDDA
jgi:hypothetical protein